jgi:UDP-N-acetylglucosamine enolpyruvyl transferase
MTTLHPGFVTDFQAITRTVANQINRFILVFFRKPWYPGFVTDFQAITPL